MDRNKILKINLTTVGILFVINLFMYNSLPSHIALQINTSGKLLNYVPKPLFIIESPIFLLLISIYFYFRNKNNIKTCLVLDAIFIISNIGIIITNIKP